MRFNNPPERIFVRGGRYYIHCYNDRDYALFNDKGFEFFGIKPDGYTPVYYGDDYLK